MVFYLVSTVMFGVISLTQIERSLNVQRRIRLVLGRVTVMAENLSPFVDLDL